MRIIVYILWTDSRGNFNVLWAGVNTRRDNPYWRSKHERISEAAFDEFTARGFELASMEKIAERAGVSKVTVYNHFKTKDRLFIQSFEYFFEFIYKRFEFDHAEASLNGDCLLSTFIAALVQHFLSPSHLSMIQLLRSEHSRLTALGIEKSENDLFSPELISALAQIMPCDGEKAHALAELVFSLVYRRCLSIRQIVGSLESTHSHVTNEIVAVVKTSGLLA